MFTSKTGFGSWGYDFNSENRPTRVKAQLFNCAAFKTNVTTLLDSATSEKINPTVSAVTSDDRESFRLRLLLDHVADLAVLDARLDSLDGLKSLRQNFQHKMTGIRFSNRKY